MHTHDQLGALTMLSQLKRVANVLDMHGSDAYT